MNTSRLEKKLRSFREEHYDEVSQYIEYLMVQQENGKKANSSPAAETYFGSLKNLPDGMDLQRSERNEWN
jgi:hypothetical protein